MKIENDIVEIKRAITSNEVIALFSYKQYEVGCFVCGFNYELFLFHFCY